MSENSNEPKKDGNKKGFNIPPIVAYGSSLFSGAYIGYEAGKGLAQYASHELDLSAGAADNFEFGAEMLGAAFVGAVAVGLAPSNPSKSVIYAAKALGAATSTAGIRYVISKLADKMDDKISQLDDKIDTRLDSLDGKIDKLSDDMASLRSQSTPSYELGAPPIGTPSPYELSAPPVGDQSPYALGAPPIGDPSPYEIATDPVSTHYDFASGGSITNEFAVTSGTTPMYDFSMHNPSSFYVPAGHETAYLNIHGLPPTDIQGNVIGRTIYGGVAPTIHGAPPIDGYGNPVYDTSQDMDHSTIHDSVAESDVHDSPGFNLG